MISRRLLFVLLACSPLLLTTTLRTASQSQTKSETELGTITFETTQGNVRVYLPGAIAAGDTISGTVTTEPTGKTEKDKQKNGRALNGLVIQFETQRWQVSSDLIQGLLIRPEITRPQLILLDEHGKQIDIATIPVTPAPITNTTPNFMIPLLAQSGRPLLITGPFDGDSSNTKVQIGGTDGKVIAESPRSAVVEIPGTVVGPNNINVNDNGHSATGNFRAIKIDLTAPKTSLMKGESTELHVEVQGLQGITQPVPVQLQNQTPQNINITGGNTQNIVIQPSQVTTGGTFNWSTNIVATGSGGFNITGTIPSTPSTTPGPSPVTSKPTATLTPVPTLPPSGPAVSPAPSPVPVTPARSSPQVFPTPTDEERFNNSFTKEDTDCCKKFLNQNDAFEISDGKGNSFRIFRNTLSMKIDGQDYEWQFTQDGKPFYIEWMFCHLNDHMIISQLSQVMIQRVKGGSSSETTNTTNISLHGPYRDEKSSRPSYGLFFTSQKAGTNTKEYSISFTMDAEFCTWSCQLLAEGKTEEFRTAPPRSAATVYNALLQATGLPTGPGEYRQQAWWNGMYSYFFEIADCCRWYRDQGDDNGMQDCERAYLLWRARLLSVLGQMRPNANADDRKLIDAMTDSLKEEHPDNEQLIKIQQAFDNLHLRYGTKVPSEIRKQILNHP